MKIDKYVKDLYERLDSSSSNNNGIIIIKDYDDDYYLDIGSEPPRFADYRAARARKCIGGTKTYEDVWDSITQDELDYYLGNTHTSCTNI